MEETDYRKTPDWWMMCQKETCPKAGGWNNYLQALEMITPSLGEKNDLYAEKVSNY